MVIAVRIEVVSVKIYITVEVRDVALWIIFSRLIIFLLYLKVDDWEQKVPATGQQHQCSLRASISTNPPRRQSYWAAVISEIVSRTAIGGRFCLCSNCIYGFITPAQASSIWNSVEAFHLAPAIKAVPECHATSDREDPRACI